MLFLRSQVIPEDRDLSVFMSIAAFLYFGRIEDRFTILLGRLARRAVRIHVGFNYKLRFATRPPFPPQNPPHLPPTSCRCKTTRDQYGDQTEHRKKGQNSNEKDLIIGFFFRASLVRAHNRAALRSRNLSPLTDPASDDTRC
jgi:hypothetical protein